MPGRRRTHEEKKTRKTEMCCIKANHNGKKN